LSKASLLLFENTTALYCFSVASVKKLGSAVASTPNAFSAPIFLIAATLSAMLS